MVESFVTIGSFGCDYIQICNHGSTSNTKILTRSKFRLPWFAMVVKEERDQFHCNFQASLQNHPLRYWGIYLGITFEVQKLVG